MIIIIIIIYWLYSFNHTVSSKFIHLSVGTSIYNDDDDDDDDGDGGDDDDDGDNNINSFIIQSLIKLSMNFRKG